MEFKIKSLLVLHKAILTNLNLCLLILLDFSRSGKGCSELKIVQTHVEYHFVKPAGAVSTLYMLLMELLIT